MKLFLDISGWAGSLMVLISYAFTLYKAKDFSSFGRYLNLFGGILIAINCLYYNAMPSFVTNIAWTFIATLSIYRAKKHLSKLSPRKNKTKGYNS